MSVSQFSLAKNNAADTFFRSIIPEDTSFTTCTYVHVNVEVTHSCTFCMCGNDATLQKVVLHIQETPVLQRLSVPSVDTSSCGCCACF